MEIKQKEAKEAPRNTKEVALHRRGRCSVTVHGAKFPTLGII